MSLSHPVRFAAAFALLIGASAALQAQPGPGGARPPIGPPIGPRPGGGSVGGGGGVGGRVGGGGGGGPRAGGQGAQSQPQYRPEELCTVEGIVRNSATGEPLSKASVVLNAGGGAGIGGGFGGGGGRGRQSYAASTAADGRFSIQGVEPGNYRFSIRRNGFVSTDMTGRRAISPSPSLTLAKSQTISNIDAKLLPHAVITGRVYDSDGEPIVYATVQLSRYRFSPQGQRELSDVTAAATNDLGEYRLFGIPPGRYVVGVMARERVAPFAVDARSDRDSGSEGPVATFYPGSADASQATPLEVAVGGSLQGIDVRMLKARTYSVSGQIAGAPAGSGRREGMVMLQPASRTAGSAPRNMLGGAWRPDGKFTIRGVPEGSYELVAESFGPDGRLHGEAQVQVGQRNVDGVQVVLQPSFDVAGAIRLEGKDSPESLENAIFTLQPRERTGGRFGGGGGGARAGADGHFLLRQLLPGLFDVNVNGLPENHYVKSVRAGQTDALATGARILPGMQIDVVVSPNGARVEGTVTNEKGEAVTAASVVLLAKDGAEAPLMRRVKTASLDQQGHFAFSGIAPGDYQLLAVDETDSGAVWDPEFIKQNDKLVEKIALRESGSESKTLKLIVTGQ